MNQLNNYRLGAYALLAIGLINLRYQTGSAGNLPKSSVLIIMGALILVFTFIPQVSSFLLKKGIKVFSLFALVSLIIYGILI